MSAPLLIKKKLLTTRVVAYRCGTHWSGLLDGAHPAVKDDGVHRSVCFSNRPLRPHFANSV